MIIKCSRRIKVGRDSALRELPATMTLASLSSEADPPAHEMPWPHEGACHCAGVTEYSRA